MREILAPAGSLAIAYTALNGGADAVYVGLKQFSARMRANNLSLEELNELCAYAHLWKKRVYVALNTLIYQDEFLLVKELVAELVKLGVDAIIVQDVGLLRYLRLAFPTFEIHASTQVNVSSKATLEFLANYGVKRAVLARETTKEELLEYQKVAIDIEMFVYGALCVAYSGLCNISETFAKRSANRGQCAQYCRLNYQMSCDDKVLNINDQYLLSPKDYNLFKYLKDLNIASYKIEGRMKQAPYVLASVQALKAIRDKNANVDYQTLLSAFYRGHTSGYYEDKVNKDMMSSALPNHQGYQIGEVVKATKTEITIKLTSDLAQFDGIRIGALASDEGMIVNFLMNEKHQLVNEVKAKELAIIKYEKPCKVNTPIFLTSSTKALKKALEFEKLEKLPVKCHIKVTVGEYLTGEFSYQYHSVLVSSKYIVETAKSKQDIDLLKEKLLKSDHSFLYVDGLTLVMDEYSFVPASELKAFRRLGLDKLYEKLIAVKPHNMSTYSKPILKEKLPAKIFWEITNIQQYKTLKTTNDVIMTRDLSLAKELGIIYVPSVIGDNSETSISVVTQLGHLDGDSKLLSYHWIGVSNSESYHFLKSFNVDYVEVAYENSDENLAMLCKALGANDLAICLYEKRPLMITRNCIIKNNLPANEGCKLCGKHQFKLKTHNNELIIKSDEHCRNWLFDVNVTNSIKKQRFYKQIGINNYIIRLQDEGFNEISSLLEILKG